VKPAWIFRLSRCRLAPATGSTGIRRQVPSPRMLSGHEAFLGRARSRDEIRPTGSWHIPDSLVHDAPL
jgi:hypothetical protein